MPTWLVPFSSRKDGWGLVHCRQELNYAFNDTCCHLDVMSVSFPVCLHMLQSSSGSFLSSLHVLHMQLITRLEQRPIKLEQQCLLHSGLLASQSMLSAPTRMWLFWLDQLGGCLDCSR